MELNIVYIWCLCGRSSNFLSYSSKGVIYHYICFNFEGSVMYLTVGLLIFPAPSCNRKISLLILRALRWNCGRVSPSPRQNEIKRSWALVPSYPSLVVAVKITTTTTTRSNPLSLFMYIMSFTCYFGAFGE